MISVILVLSEVEVCVKEAKSSSSNYSSYVSSTSGVVG